MKNSSSQKISRNDALIEGVEVLEVESWIKTPDLDARVLLLHAEGISREELLLRPQEEMLNAVRYRELLRLRRGGDSVAVLVGYKDFFGRIFRVNENVLVPRPETEELVERAIELIRTYELKTCLDIGSGSGCIAASVALETIGQSEVSAIEPSGSAYLVANDNFKSLNAPVRSSQVSMSGYFSEKKEIDLVLANLPYVPVAMQGEPSIEREPFEALFSGDDGLDHYVELFSHIEKGHLRTQYLLLEHLPGQFKELNRLAGNQGYQLTRISEFVSEACLISAS